MSNLCDLCLRPSPYSRPRPRTPPMIFLALIGLLAIAAFGPVGADYIGNKFPMRLCKPLADGWNCTDLATNVYLSLIHI